MKPVLRMRIFGAIIAASFVFWLAETGYFGWNMTPQSHAELACDQIVNVIFFSAWLIFCMPSLRFLRAINPFQRVRWFYIEQGADGSETITARRLTRFWRACSGVSKRPSAPAACPRGLAGL